MFERSFGTDAVVKCERPPFVHKKFGYGEFDIKVDIHVKNVQTQLRKRLRLFPAAGETLVAMFVPTPG